MIDSQSEQLLTLSTAAREVPNRASGLGVNVSTVWRWTLRGIRGVQLETLLIGGVRYTSREALQRFFQATTNSRASVHPSPARRTAVDQAERELSDAGI